MNIEFKDREIIINGKSEILLAAEVHYFRLDPSEWQHVITKAKEAGMNAIDAYIPWCLHEQIEGDFDFTGRYKSQYDLVSFLKLVAENDLYFLSRPGPFVNADLVNDGIPTWVSEKYPAVVPHTWDNKEVPTATLDYLNPDFLKAGEKWIKEVGKLVNNIIGDKLVAIQVDNEIGMMSWLSNSPDITEIVAKDLVAYIREYGHKDVYDFLDEPIKVVQQKFASPEDSFIIEFHEDLMNYSRIRYSKYVDIIESWYKDIGMGSTKFGINIHGTDFGAGVLDGYPTGLSQLKTTFENKENFFSGSDLYFNHLNIDNIEDTIIANIFTESLNNSNQPLTSLEYGGHDGNYYCKLDKRSNATTFRLRTRMMITQNNKMINFYIFHGGYNDFMNKNLNNGTDRISPTGEDYSYGSSLTPDLKENHTFHYIKETGMLVQNLNKYLASMKQERDSIEIAFIADYYKTEYTYNNEKIKDKHDHLKMFRGNKQFESIVRYFGIRSIQPSAINIEEQIPTAKLLIVPTANYMSPLVQQRIVNYLINGGQVVLFGAAPTFDMFGNPCTILLDFLEIKTGETLVYKFRDKKRIMASPDGIAADCVDSIICYATEIKSSHSPLIKIHDPNIVTAITIEKEYKAACIFNEYRCDVPFFDHVMNFFNVDPILKIEQYSIGILGNVMTSDKGNIIAIFNMDEKTENIKVNYHGKDVFEGNEIELTDHEALFLPVKLMTNIGEIIYSTNEIFNIENDRLTFRLTGKTCKIKLKTNDEIYVDSDFTEVRRDGEFVYINKSNRLVDEKELIVYINR